VTTASSLTSAAEAIQAQAAGASGISFTWVILGVLVLFWLFMIVQSRRRKQQQLQQRAGMEPGTRVMLTSGIIGTLVERTPDTMVVEVADGVQLTVVPGAIARTLPTLDPSADTRGFGENVDTADTPYSGYSDHSADPDTAEPSTDDPTDLGTAPGETPHIEGSPADDPTQPRRDTGSGGSAIHEDR
jgi:preprotein translocase subunit YajC